MTFPSHRASQGLRQGLRQHMDPDLAHSRARWLSTRLQQLPKMFRGKFWTPQKLPVGATTRSMAFHQVADATQPASPGACSRTQDSRRFVLHPWGLAPAGPAAAVQESSDEPWVTQSTVAALQTHSLGMEAARHTSEHPAHPAKSWPLLPSGLRPVWGWPFLRPKP